MSNNTNLKDIATMDEMVNNFIASAAEAFGEDSKEVANVRDALQEAAKVDGVTGQIGSMAAGNLLGRLTREGMSGTDICELHLTCLIGYLFQEVVRFTDSMDLTSPDLIAMIHDASVMHMIGTIEGMSPKKVRSNKANFWLGATFMDLTTSKWKAASH